MEGTTIPHKMLYHASNGKTLIFYKQHSTDKLTLYEEHQIQEKIHEVEETPITYDECLDITGDDPGEIIQEQTGVHPSTMFRRTLLEHGYTNEEINQIQPYPIEEIKPIKNNSIYKKKAPYGINHTYKLKYVKPITYKKVLLKTGIPINNIPYWKNLEQMEDNLK
jgi:hypothetical protein